MKAKANFMILVARNLRYATEPNAVWCYYRDVLPVHLRINISTMARNGRMSWGLTGMTTMQEIMTQRLADG